LYQRPAAYWQIQKEDTTGLMIIHITVTTILSEPTGWAVSDKGVPELIRI